MNNDDVNCKVHYDIQSFVQEISNCVRALPPKSILFSWYIMSTSLLYARTIHVKFCSTKNNGKFNNY